MFRRNRNQGRHINSDNLLAEIDRLKASPLGSIFAELHKGLVCTQAAYSAGGCSQLQMESFLNQAHAVAQLMPKNFTDRFDFDAQMIGTLQTSWNGSKQRLSQLIIPVSGDTWAHQGTFLPVKPVNSTQGKVASINVIYIPGDGELGSIDLLHYPFLCHELAHNLYFFDDLFFRQQFDKKLGDFISKLRLRSISDHGAAKKASENMRSEIEAFWRPTPHHQNWAHEIAMDLTALWTCGPAYLAALLDELDGQHLDPYFIGQEHPPYAVRVEALIFACRQLGWMREADELGKHIRQWQQSAHYKQVSNRYVALTDTSLTADCVRCALETCRHHNLPKCDQQTIARVRQKLNRNETPDWGTELILAAWLKYEMNNTNYDAWQQSVIRELLDSLKP